MKTNKSIVDTTTPAKMSVEEKVDSLLVNISKVKRALNIRSIITAMAVIIPVSLGAFGLYHQNRTNHNLAKAAFIQSLNNNHDLLLYRRDFAQTRDCPVAYFKSLLDVSRERGDLTTVQPPCDPIDIASIDEQIADIEKRIALATK